MKEFELTQEQLDNLLSACKPVPYVVFCGKEPKSPQENANSEWERLGEEMGFYSMTVRPIDGKSQRFFTAMETNRQENKE